MTELKLDDPKIRENYADVMDWLESLGVRPRVFEEKDGVLRFRSNEIIRETQQLGLDMNEIARRWYKKLEQRAEFYTLIGYSLSGFAEIFSDQLEEFSRAEGD